LRYPIDRTPAAKSKTPPHDTSQGGRPAVALHAGTKFSAPVDARPIAAAGIQSPPINAAPPSVQLGPGDTVAIKVFGQPYMDGTVSVADDGTIHLPLVGSVQVGGLSPDQVSRKVEKALKDGSFLVNPHVTLTLTQSVNQLVAVLGEVKAPGRYQVSANTSIFQLLAQAGGVTSNSADVIYLIRSDADGKPIRTPIDLKGYTQCHFFAGIGGWSGALRLARWPDRREVWTGSTDRHPAAQDRTASGVRRT